MKKVTAQLAKWAPFALFILSTLYFAVNVISGYRITPYSQYLFCGAVAVLYLLTAAVVFTDKTKWEDKIKQIGCGMLPITTLAAACSLTFTVNSYLAIATAAVLVGLSWVIFTKGTEDSGFIRLFRGLSLAALIFLLIFCIHPLTSGQDRGVVSDFRVYGEQFVAECKVRTAIDRQYKTVVTVRKAGADLGFARMVGITSQEACTRLDDIEGFSTPSVVWDGQTLLVNGEEQLFLFD